jgi:hypothetical protein
MIADQPKPPPPPGLPLTINFNIPAHWTPEQALAVFELLDDLRNQIGAHYSVQLFEISREQHSMSVARVSPKKLQSPCARLRGGLELEPSSGLGTTE